MPASCARTPSDDIIGMRIVHISSGDNLGGAAIAAHRLHSELREAGCDSVMIAGNRDGCDLGIRQFHPPADWPSRVMRYARRKNLQAAWNQYRTARPSDASLFSGDRSVHYAALLAQVPSCDVIHLHWVAGLFDYRAFLPAAARQAPLVWTLHDMNPFTGGCHHDYGCGRFANQCGACPQLGYSNPHDLTRVTWRRKRRAFTSIPAGRLQVVAPSQWLAGEARRASLFRDFPVCVIPNGLDMQTFAPREKLSARVMLGIPADARVLLFVAQWLGDPLKGFSHLAHALTGMTDVPGLFLLSVGKFAGALPVPIPCRNLGIVHDPRLLSMIYSAADLFLLPSLQDNLPNTMLESLACGTPIIAYGSGGIPEVVRDGVNGMLVPTGDVAALRSTILSVLSDPARRSAMSENARRLMLREYTLKESARRYAELYASLCGGTYAHPQVEIAK